jgi:23S rRNA (guanosine2251-2'-O)-methyltransferase
MAQQKNLEVVYGVHPVTELIKAKKRKVSVVYTTKPSPKAFNIIQGQLPSYIEVRFVSKQHLEKLCGTPDHQGIVALATPIQIRKKFFDPKKQPLLVLLDGIQDPRNMGAIIRSAFCANVSGVILSKKGSSSLSGTVNKSSAGLLEHTDLYVASGPTAAIAELKAAGYKIFLATVDDSIPVTKVDFDLPCCIVIGNEGMGITKSILSSGQHISIPQQRDDISYNASVAAGILFFLASSQNKLI